MPIIPLKCEKCSFRNVFLITNEKVHPVDGDECGIFGLAKCNNAYFKYCNGVCYVPLNREHIIQLTLDF